MLQSGVLVAFHDGNDPDIILSAYIKRSSGSCTFNLASQIAAQTQTSRYPVFGHCVRRCLLIQGISGAQH
jgi:hypothetical protein